MIRINPEEFREFAGGLGIKQDQVEAAIEELGKDGLFDLRQVYSEGKTEYFIGLGKPVRDLAEGIYQSPLDWKDKKDLKKGMSAVMYCLTLSQLTGEEIGASMAYCNFLVNQPHGEEYVTMLNEALTKDMEMVHQAGAAFRRMASEGL